jgi:uncharacterized protein YqfB (UPF0267 family)
MRLIQFIFIIILFNSRCNQSSQKNPVETHKLDLSKLEKHFIEIYTNGNSQIIVEDFKLVKIDTLTLKNQYLELCKNVMSIRKKITDSLIKIDKEITHYDSLQKSSNPMSLSYKRDADNAKIRFMSMMNQDSILNEKYDKYFSKMKIADSVKPIALKAMCSATINNENMRYLDLPTKMKDTFGIFLDNDYNIIGKEGYLKILQSLY